MALGPGAAVAWSLAETRMNILCLEQGPWVDSETFPSTRPDYELYRYGSFSCDPNVRRLPEDYPINAEESPITPVNFNAVGGATVNYLGHWPRFHPSDFRAKTLDGVADDWPVDYKTLEQKRVDIDDLQPRDEAVRVILDAIALYQTEVAPKLGR